MAEAGYLRQIRTALGAAHSAAACGEGVSAQTHQAVKDALAALESVGEIVGEYAYHHRECRAIDHDGEWHTGNPPCSCGYDEAVAALGAE